MHDTMACVMQAMADLREQPNRRHTAVRNLVVFAMAVTNTIQNLRSIVKGFDDWWLPIADELRKDPRAKFFYKLRSRILKEGDAGVGSYSHVVSSNGTFAQFGAPPPGAIEFEVGDRFGGSGWVVQTGPETTEMYYINLPPEQFQAGLYFKDAPDGGTVSDRDVITLCEKYVETIQSVVEHADRTFGLRSAVKK